MYINLIWVGYSQIWSKVSTFSSVFKPINFAETYRYHKFAENCPWSLKSINLWHNFRSSNGKRCKICVLKYLTKFSGKKLYRSLFYTKVATLKPKTFFKKTLIQLFSCEFCKIFNNTTFNRTPRVAASVICFVFTKFTEQKIIGKLPIFHYWWKKNFFAICTELSFSYKISKSWFSFSNFEVPQFCNSLNFLR